MKLLILPIKSVKCLNKLDLSVQHLTLIFWTGYTRTRIWFRIMDLREALTSGAIWTSFLILQILFTAISSLLRQQMDLTAPLLTKAQPVIRPQSLRHCILVLAKLG